MKTFRTSGTGSGQTLSEIESDKMPIYNTMADAEADLANLEIGQIIAINTIGTERLAYVVSENGTKRIKDLTANVGTGAPVGSYIYMEKKSSPQGYLYCDGSTFDETVYPALYQYLGTNVLPDFREFSAVGAEQNTTNVYDTSTNPNGVIHDHDVYAEGEAKDDQLQDHAHNNTWSRRSGTYFEGVASSDYEMQDNPLVSHEGVYGARTGTTTHGKRKAVFVYIKATSGLTENQQENVLNTINENLSYSTTEHATGKKWIDGKMIYNRVIMCSTALTFTPNQWTSLVSYFSGMTDLMAVIDTLINAKIEAAKDTNISNAFESVINSSAAQAKTAGDYTITATGGYISVEYTKTV